MEEIHDDALVSAEMILPRLLSNNLYKISTWKGIEKKIKRRKNGYKSKEQQQKTFCKVQSQPGRVYLINPAFGVIELDVWLIMDPIQILMEPVQEERQQLLRVMLLVAVERRSVFSDNRTQFERHQGPTCAAPELTDQLRRSVRQSLRHSRSDLSGSTRWERVRPRSNASGDGCKRCTGRQSWRSTCCRDCSVHNSLFRRIRLLGWYCRIGWGGCSSWPPLSRRDCSAPLAMSNPDCVSTGKIKI